MASSRNLSIRTGLPRRHLERLRHVRRQRVLVVDDLHRPAAEHEARPDEHREADLAGRRGQRLRQVHGGAVGRLLAARVRSTSAANRSRSSARSIESTLVPMIGTPAASSGLGQVQRRLPAELDDHARRASSGRRC